jgi:hypothetical protein
MAATSPSSPAAGEPAEFVSFVSASAEADAVRVGEFLRQVGLAPVGEQPTLPPALLLDLGAALRFAEWEEAGLDVHRRDGLPDARSGILRALTGPGTGPTADLPDYYLHLAVLNLFAHRLAWTGPSALGADVVIDAPDEDDLIEALAHCLLAHGSTTVLPDPEATP